MDSRDFDFVVPASPDDWRSLARRLSEDLSPSPFNTEGSPFLVFEGEILGDPVDIALVPAGEAEAVRRAIERIRNELTDDRRREIVARKTALRRAWFFPRRRYRSFKKRVERELGFPRLRRRKWFKQPG